MVTPRKVYTAEEKDRILSNPYRLIAAYERQPDRPIIVEVRYDPRIEEICLHDRGMLHECEGNFFLLKIHYRQFVFNTKCFRWDEYMLYPDFVDLFNHLIEEVGASDPLIIRLAIKKNGEVNIKITEAEHVETMLEALLDHMALEEFHMLTHPEDKKKREEQENADEDFSHLQDSTMVEDDIPEDDADLFPFNPEHTFELRDGLSESECLRRPVPLNPDFPDGAEQLRESLLAQSSPMQPGPFQPGPFQPSSSRPGSSRPGSSRLGSSKPGPAQPSPSKPGTSKPGPSQSGPSQSGPSQPVHAHPFFAQPAPWQPGNAQPDYAQPNYSQPSMFQPGMFQPGMFQPDYSQPGMFQPGMYQPGMAQPGMAQPGMAQPGMAQPGMVQPSPAESTPVQQNAGYMLYPPNGPGTSDDLESSHTGAWDAGIYDATFAINNEPAATEFNHTFLDDGAHNTLKEASPSGDDTLTDMPTADDKASESSEDIEYELQLPDSHLDYFVVRVDTHGSFPCFATTFPAEDTRIIDASINRVMDACIPADPATLAAEDDSDSDWETSEEESSRPQTKDGEDDTAKEEDEDAEETYLEGQVVKQEEPTLFGKGPFPISKSVNEIKEKVLAEYVRKGPNVMNGKTVLPLMYNPRHEIMSCGEWVVIFCRNGRWYTPHISSGCRMDPLRTFLLKYQVVFEAALLVQGIREDESILLVSASRGVRHGRLIGEPPELLERYKRKRRKSKKTLTLEHRAQAALAAEHSSEAVNRKPNGRHIPFTSVLKLNNRKKKTK